MKHKHLVVLIFVLLVGSFLSVRPLPARSNDAQQSHMFEFPIGVASLNVAVEKSGHIWFTSPSNNLIGSLTVTSTTDFAVKTYTIPTADSEPYDLVVSNGAVWFTEKAGNKIGKFSIDSRSFKEYAIPTSKSEPKGITAAKNGDLWFVESKGNKLVKMTSASTPVFTEILYTTADAQFEDIAVDGSGNVWASSPNLNRVVFYNSANGKFLPVPTGANSQPMGVAVDSGNQSWVATFKQNYIGRYAPGTLTLWRWFEAPSADSNPVGISVNSVQGNIAVWFTEQATDMVGRLLLQPDGTMLELLEGSLPTGGSAPWGVSMDTTNTVWIAAPGASAIVRWSAPYFERTYLPVVAR